MSILNGYDRVADYYFQISARTETYFTWERKRPFLVAKTLLEFEKSVSDPSELSKVVAACDNNLCEWFKELAKKEMRVWRWPSVEEREKIKEEIRESLG